MLLKTQENKTRKKEKYFRSPPPKNEFIRLICRNLIFLILLLFSVGGSRLKSENPPH